MPQGYMSHKKNKGSEKPKVSGSREKPKAFWTPDIILTFCVREWGVREWLWANTKKKNAEKLKNRALLFSYLSRTFATLNLSKKGNNGHVH